MSVELTRTFLGILIVVYPIVLQRTSNSSRVPIIDSSLVLIQTDAQTHHSSDHVLCALMIAHEIMSAVPVRSSYEQ